MASSVATDTTSLDELVQRIADRERTARQRAVVFTLVPILVGASILIYAGRQLGQTNAQISEAQAQLESKQKQADGLTKDLVAKQQELAAERAKVDTLRTQVADLQDQLRRATDLSQYVYKGSILQDAKELSVFYPRQWPLLSDVLALQQQGVPWHLGGTTVQDGFDSPSFAVYVLAKHGLLPTGVTADQARARLTSLYPPRTPQAQNGDLIFYNQGYAMFFFRDLDRQDFVIGMTPFGILALKANFAGSTGIGAVTY